MASEVFNEHLTEKLSRRREPRPIAGATAFVRFLPAKLNHAVRAYYNNCTPQADQPAWTSRSALPTSAEIEDLVVEGQDSDVVHLLPNRVKGAWESKEEYLGAHYELLREDAIRPLREAVCQLRATPNMNEDASRGGKVGIYGNTHIIGYIASSRGFAVHVSFSLQRTGKAISWTQTNRLMPGSLVALSCDNFQSVSVASVAARPTAGTEKNPPELDLFFARAEEVQIDPAVEWTMVEARGSLFEASKHVLSAIQHMSREKSPFLQHLVEVKPDVSPPTYLNHMHTPPLDRASLSELDVSQLEALQRIITKSLAIVQGPPGTGKTFVSVKALQIMLGNRQDGDPPIIVACQTNHAVDQILKLVATFEPDFARLGGFSKDKDVIKKRTIHELRQSERLQSLPGCLATGAYQRCRALEKELVKLLAPLEVSSTAMDPGIFYKHGLLKEKQVTTLTEGASKWVQAELIASSKTRSPFHVWLATKLVAVPEKPQPEESAFDFEEEDVELEQLQETEAENAKDDDLLGEMGLIGDQHKLADNFTCAAGSSSDKQKAVDMLLTQQDMWKIPESLRAGIYRHLQSSLKAKLTIEARNLVAAFSKAVADAQIGRFEKDEVILRRQHLIGMTTTGLNKYRGLSAALGCKIVLIEEAAETLEAPVLTACIPTLEHFILVGDHKQLRPHCQVKALEGAPFHLDVSLFERMVNNDIEFSMLKKQRRMIPEIRRLLRPIYGSTIKDHDSVSKRHDIPGMGGINSFFISHTAPEARDEFMSYRNPEEAAMIRGFVQYLINNGVKAQDVTIITFYRGQQALLNRQFRVTGVNIATVDSYQGEENKIVILSMVRSNEARSIGFLAVDNRTCVALSRARDGFYIFGNGYVLAKCKIWQKVIMIIAGKHDKDPKPAVMPCRFDQKLPICCSNHKTWTEISSSSDWENNCGGCQEKCNGSLPCGHDCPDLCHPYSHDTILCQKACKKVLPCGHDCTEVCSKPCACSKCPKPKAETKKDTSIKSSPRHTTAEANGRILAARQRSPVSNGPRRHSPLKQEVLIAELDLLDLQGHHECAEQSQGVVPMVAMKTEVSTPSERSLLD